MPKTDPSERRIRRRWRVLTAAGLIFLVSAFSAYQVVERMDAGGARTVDLVRMGGLVLLALVLSIRSTTSFTLLPRNPVMDDEHTRENRLRAGRWGFWAMLLASIAVALLSLRVEVALFEALLTVVFAGAAAATFRFVRLERRGADGD